MEKFINRKEELRVLNENIRSKESLILVNGPHHVGKTELIKELIKDKPAFYFNANEFSDELNRENLYNLIRKSYQNVPEAPITPSWDDLFKFIAFKAPTEKSILVIDNFDNLIQGNSEFERTFDNIWNRILLPNKVTTIILLPNNNILVNLVNGNSLIKDIGLRLQLKPIPFFELMHRFPNKPIYELASIYNLSGGYPLYWDYFIKAKSLVEQIDLIIELMARPGGFFYDLPLTLLHKNVWDLKNYSTILYYLANDVNDFEELLTKTNFKKTQLVKALTNLEQLGYVTSKKSIHRKRSSQKNKKYFLINPMFKFWYRFIYPNRSLLNENELRAEIVGNYTSYIEGTFNIIGEEMFIASVNQNLLDFTLSEYGPFWNDKVEIPIVAIDKENKKIFFGDNQFSLKNYDLEEFIDFTKSTLNLREFRKYKNYERMYGLFTANTPSEDLIRYTVNNDDTFIFSGTKLIS